MDRVEVRIGNVVLRGSEYRILKIMGKGSILLRGVRRCKR